MLVIELRRRKRIYKPPYYKSFSVQLIDITFCSAVTPIVTSILLQNNQQSPIKTCDFQKRVNCFHCTREFLFLALLISPKPSNWYLRQSCYRITNKDQFKSLTFQFSLVSIFILLFRNFSFHHFVDYWKKDFGAKDRLWLLKSLFLSSLVRNHFLYDQKFENHWVFSDHPRKFISKVYRLANAEPRSQ